MAVLTVIYPRSDDAVFDYTYFEVMHLPMVRERWGSAGLVGVEALRGLPDAAGNQSPFMAMALVRFATLDQLLAATGGEHMGEIAEDLAKFSNVQPVIQVNEEMG